ncbi:hypothetical protein L6475_02320 [Prevotella sp. E9-3]|nr:hypothetical protein [Prevotella sp. E9-3]UKK48829.1 hypothetical protein L6475_02320 [Prevotella sp. E9-3]
MKCKDYEKPLIKAIILLQQTPLLSISGEISGYGKNSREGFTQDDEKE